MKHLPIVFALAASCVVSNFCHVAHAAPTQNLAAEVVPSLEKYQLNMIEGRQNKAESAKSYSQSKSQLAALAFFRARDFALTSPQRGEALVEAGETLSPMAAMTDAITAFRDALKEQISPELKGRALMGIADSEYHVAFMRGELAKYATILRNNYLEATKIHKASDGEMAKIWQNLAKIADAEKKHLEAAQSYAKVLGNKGVEHLWPYVARYAIEQLQKTTELSPNDRKAAAELTDKVFLVYFSLLKSESDKPSWRVAQADLLSRFGESARAETMLNAVADDAKAPEKMRVETIVKIAQRQAAQKKYDAALLTLDRLSPLFLYGIKRNLERGKVFLAQEKYELAKTEFFRVAILGTSEEKVDGYWGLADVAEKHAAALRLKKTPATEIAAQVEEQKKALTKASTQIGVSAVTRRMSYEKLAQFETAQGNVAEAKKWQEAAAAAKASQGK